MDGTRAEELVERYADAILRIGYTWLGDMDDAKDICQTVLIKLVEEGRRFPDLGQERAWVVRLSVNACKNWKKSAWFRRRAPLEEGLHLAAEAPEPEDGALLALVNGLPPNTGRWSTCGTMKSTRYTRSRPCWASLPPW